MNKLLAFRFPNYSNIIYGEYRVSEDKVYYKHINCEDNQPIFYENVEDITTNHSEFFVEDNEVWEALIENIKNDNSILDKIKRNTGTKLLFQYEYVEEY